jgi:hypothetical protein
MKSGKRILLWSGALAIAGVAVGLAFFGRDAEPTLRFYGRVVDESGRPIAGAHVDAAAFEIKPALANQDLQRVMASELPLAADTDDAGRFTLTAGNRRYELQIKSVSKAGYDWVFDQAWSLRRPGFERKDNRFYRFASPYASTNVYSSDVDRPAIFPMHRKDSSLPASRPSRGGWEILAEGRAVENAPARLAVPSAGPSAPTTPEETDRRLNELGPED